MSSARLFCESINKINAAIDFVNGIWYTLNQGPISPPFHLKESA